MKGLVVNRDNIIELKEGLVAPIAGQGEILIKIKSASVNPFDVESAKGTYDGYFAEYGFDKEVKTGLEFSGVVMSDGEQFVKGDKVFGYVHMLTGWKTHAEYIAIDEHYVALMPEQLSYAQAAAIPLGALTTLVALQDLGHLKAGMKLLINGASGGLGIQAIQIGKMLGAQVSAIAGNEQEAFLCSYGADTVYDYTQTSIGDLTGSFDVILDLTNAQKLEAMKRLLTPTGIFIPGEPNDDNGGLLDDPQVAYLMVAHGDSTKLTQIANWVSDGKLKAVIDSEFHFSEYPQAIERVQTKGRRGRIIMSW